MLLDERQLIKEKNHDALLHNLDFGHESCQHPSFAVFVVVAIVGWRLDQCYISL